MSRGHRGRTLCGLFVVWLGLLGSLADAATEEQITSAPLSDIEFDSARDGSYCVACNFGDGNARVSFVDFDGRLWVARVDLASGRFVPEDGRGTLVDTDAAYFTQFGNGPSWMFSRQGSELVYTRYLPGAPPQPANAGIGWARMVAPGAWDAGMAPDGLGRVAPKGSTGVDDPVARVSYGAADRSAAFWRAGDFGSPEVLLPKGDSNRGLGLRWVAGTSKILVSSAGNSSRAEQIHVHDTATGRTEQITRGPGGKRAQLMLFPPEFAGAAVCFVVVDDRRFDVYRRQPGSRGRWVLSHTLLPPQEEPFIAGSPEAFVHDGRTWIVLTTAASVEVGAASSVAIMALDPARPEFRRLTAADAPARWRSDPEYYIGEGGVYIYFTRSLPLADGIGHEGIWRVNTGLAATRR